MRRIMVIMFVIVTALFSDMSFANKLGIKYQTKDWSDSYCHTYSNGEKLCMDYVITYPIDIRGDNQKAVDIFKSQVEKIVTKYKKSGAKKDILDMTLDDSDPIVGSWTDEYTVELLASTQKTLTLSYSGGGYMGGAHGNYGTEFINFDIDSGRKISIADIISGTKSSFTKAVERYYRDTNGLGMHDSLTRLEWFENKFALADNFAITDKGIYFYYNSYEIKAYAYGQTELLVPYRNLGDTIDSHGVLSTYVSTPQPISKPQSNNKVYRVNNLAEITIYSKNLGSGLVSVEVEMKNLSLHNRGWLSISFPQLRYRDSIVKSNSVGFDTLLSYPRGKKIYHNMLRKAVRASYLLVEGEATRWYRGDTKSISLIVDAPRRADSLIVYVRGSYKDRRRPVVSFPNDGVDGQQGFYNYTLRVDL